MDLAAPVLAAARRQAEEFIALRRDIHRNPELAFQEHRTADLVATRLREWGYEVSTGIGGTGVVGQLRRGSGKRRLGIRADMDALPISEASGRPWASCRPGIMHACGHDGHTAMLLAAARQLARDGRFDGALNLIFQPAEEAGGGAKCMLDDGLLERFPCDAIFAMHNMPGLPQGTLAFCEGAALTSSDNATVRLLGRGGHGAMPHQAADPVVATASLVMALQTVVSRNVAPLDMAVLTVGEMHAGTASNIIPEQARIELNVRTLDPEVRALIQRRVRELVAAHADSFGVRAEIDWRPGYPVLVNSAAETNFARAVAAELLGPEQVIAQTRPQTASEDCAYLLEQVPGSYLFIGNGTGAGPHACMQHNPGFDFNDDNVAVGGAFWVLLAERFMPAGAAGA